ncbi:pyridoxal-phosphate dependent enzyme [Vicingaceae bacterium]|nr:pyridoxal-phosphate dependent enzyme [Vicingaceae bacterium]
MKSDVNENNIPLQKIEADFLLQKNVELFILREDLIHPQISGNKWRKIKYNIVEAKEKDFDTLLTFGGAFSNHIAATAAAGNKFGLKTIGIIRGEEVKNPTLYLAKENGMELKFVSREEYRVKDASKYPDCYVVPEGGSNALAVKGCSEIVENITVDYDVICCACGTGGTIAGIISSTDKQVLGFPALKGGQFLIEDIKKLLIESKVNNNSTNWKLITDYHFGGYAKVKPELIDFVKEFKGEHNILLDFIYTGKMLFGLFDMIKNSNQLDNKKIVVVHTGGIQGNKGFEDRFGIVI